MQRLYIPLILLMVAFGANYASDELGSVEISNPVVTDHVKAATPMLSARRMPAFLVNPIAANALASQLDDVVSPEFSATCLHVADGENVIYSHQADLPFTPASVQKIVTGFAAIEELGAGHRFTTRLMVENTPSNGVLQGNLYLVGSGDPLLMTADYAQSFKDQPQLRTSAEELADRLISAGVTSINGAVLGVEVKYDDDRYPDGWPADGRFATQGQSGPLSALMINDGFTTFPATSIDRDLGELPVAADDPALHAAQLFDDLLEAREVRVSGSARNISRADFEPVSPDLIELASIDSPSMEEIVGQMLTQSDNTTAELLTKAIGYSANNAGTTPVGTRAIVNIITNAGLPALEVPPVDGSGLAASNKLSCGYVVELLGRAGPGTPLGDALPVSGVDGTLADRFVGTVAEGRIHAKTGSLRDVTALAGWVQADDGKTLTFAYMVNLSGGDTVTDSLVNLQEGLGVAMVQYPQGPSVDEVAPPE